MDIYYYSGTGNSLHVARQIAARFPEARLLPMVGLLGERTPSSSAKVIGFVFPIYLASLPRPVKEFAERLELPAARYVFAVATRTGTSHVADRRLDRILRHKGHGLDAFFVLGMTINSPCGLVPKSFPGFKKMTSEWPSRIAPERVAERDAAVAERIPEIEQIIRGHRTHHDETGLGTALSKAMMGAFTAAGNRTQEKAVIPYYASDECTGCGICVEVCPSSRVGMTEDGRPQWHKEVPCFFCYACFNWCPEQAILLRDRYTEQRGRFTHPSVSHTDIAAQKAKPA